MAPKSNEQPKSKELHQVQLMNHAGGIVTLPTDLQTPFARYISRSNVMWMKRYSVDQVYFERKLVGLHPKVNTELAFDIVAPSPGSFLADAEVLATLSDIFRDPRLKITRTISLQMGHLLLLKAVLIYCGIPEEKRADLCKVLKLRSKSDGQIFSRVAGLAIPRQSLEVLLNLLELEGSVSKVIAALTNVVSRKGDAASSAKQALHELDVIITHAEHMGLRLQVKVRIDIALEYYTSYSGMVFQFVSQSTQKR